MEQVNGCPLLTFRVTFQHGEWDIMSQHISPNTKKCAPFFNKAYEVD